MGYMLLIPVLSVGFSIQGFPIRAGSLGTSSTGTSHCAIDSGADIALDATVIEHCIPATVLLGRFAPCVAPRGRAL